MEILAKEPNGLMKEPHAFFPHTPSKLKITQLSDEKSPPLHFCTHCLPEPAASIRSSPRISLSFIWVHLPLKERAFARLLLTMLPLTFSSSST